MILFKLITEIYITLVAYPFRQLKQWNKTAWPSIFYFFFSCCILVTNFNQQLIVSKVIEIQSWNVIYCVNRIGITVKLLLFNHFFCRIHSASINKLNCHQLRCHQQFQFPFWPRNVQLCGSILTLTLIKISILWHKLSNCISRLSPGLKPLFRLFEEDKSEFFSKNFASMFSICFGCFFNNWRFEKSNSVDNLVLLV